MQTTHPHHPYQKRRQHLIPDDDDGDLGHWSRQKLQRTLFAAYPEAEADLTWRMLEQYRRARYYQQTGDNVIQTTTQPLPGRVLNTHTQADGTQVYVTTTYQEWLDPEDDWIFLESRPGKMSPHAVDAIELVEHWRDAWRNYQNTRRQHANQRTAARSYPKPHRIIDAIQQRLNETSGPSPDGLQNAPEYAELLGEAVREHYPAVADTYLDYSRDDRTRLHEYLAAWSENLRRRHRNPDMKPKDEFSESKQAEVRRLLDHFKQILHRLDVEYEDGEFARINQLFADATADQEASTPIDDSGAGSSSSSSSGGDGGDDSELSDTALRIENILDDEEWTSRQELSEMLDVSPATVTVRTKELREDGRIEEDRQGNEKVYRLR